MSAPHIRFEAVMLVFRGYEQPGGFEAHRPYDLTGSVFLLGRGQARLFATHGTLDDPTIGAIFRHLETLGVTVASVNRHGRERDWPVARWKTLGRGLPALHLHWEDTMVVAPTEDGQISAFLFGEGLARVFSAPAAASAIGMDRILEGLAPWGIHTVLACRHGVEQIWKKDLGRAAAIEP